MSDGKGGTGSATVSAVVAGANIAPTVTATRNPTGNTRVGVPVIFAATGTDPDGDTLTYSWDFGDGTAAVTDQNPTHTFLTAATFTVKVTVSDGKGGTGSRRSASSSPPTARRRSRPRRPRRPTASRRSR